MWHFPPRLPQSGGGGALGGGVDRAVDVGVGVGEAREQRLVAARREVHAAVEQAVEEARVALVVGGPAPRRSCAPARRAKNTPTSVNACVTCAATPARRTPSRRPSREPGRDRLRARRTRRRRAAASAARPAAVASGFPDSVPAWYTGPSGASSSISAAGPPTAASGSPPPTTLPKIERSGVMPKRSCAPPTPTRKPVITSSNTSSAPLRVHRSRRPVEEAVGRAARDPCWRRSARRGPPRRSAPCSASAASSAARSL